MTSRERVLLALDHREADRVPLDLGSTTVTGIHRDAYTSFRAHVGLPAVEPTVIDTTQQIVRVDDDVMDALGVDTRGSLHDDPREISDDGEYKSYFDEWGVGWRMPAEDGLYFDMFRHPLAGEISHDDVERFPWPDGAAPEYVAHLAALGERTAAENRALVVSCPFSGIVEHAVWLRGFEDGLADFAADPDLIAHVMDRVLDLKVAFWEGAFRVLGDAIDVAAEFDDLGTQHSLFFSPETYRRLIKPRHAALFAAIHDLGRARVFLHSDGAIRTILPDLIESGVDILNPLQVSADGMDSASIKREFGDDLVFWGGGVDTQNVLGSATPDGVRAEVRRRLDDLMPGGGFVFATVHNIQANVPAANLEAMLEALRDFGAYA